MAGKLLKFEETSLMIDIQLILRHGHHQGEEEVRYLPPSLESWEKIKIEKGIYKILTPKIAIKKLFHPKYLW
jgi:hypothetical protein